MTRPRSLLTACAAVLLASCETTPKHYVTAFRATYDAVEPEYRAYIEADTAIDEPTRKRRLNTLKAWKVWLEAAEGQR